MLIILRTVLGTQDRAGLGDLAPGLSEGKHIVKSRLTLSHALWSRGFSNCTATKQTKSLFKY